jgi:hypothetical protein
MGKHPFALARNYGELNGYTDENQVHKDRFLREGKKLLKEVAQELAALGLGESSEIKPNPAGIAVSGEVWVHFWNPQTPGFCVTCWIAESVMGTREDRVLITARKDEWKQEHDRKKLRWRTGRLGVNRSVPTRLNSKELARVLFDIYTTGDFMLLDKPPVGVLRPAFYTPLPQNLHENAEPVSTGRSGHCAVQLSLFAEVPRFVRGDETEVHV